MSFLSNSFIKANHGCRWHQIVYDKSTLDIDRTVRRFNNLYKRRFGWISGERHYSFIQPKIVIEKLLRGPHGDVPWDYSFFCYNGPGGFDYNFSIVTPAGNSAAFQKDWTVLECDIPEQEQRRICSPQILKPWCRSPETFPRIFISSVSTSTRSRARFALANSHALPTVALALSRTSSAKECVMKCGISTPETRCYIALPTNSHRIERLT